MVCSNCSTVNFRDHKYCRECGRPLAQAASPWDPTRMDGTIALNGGHPQDAQVQALLEQAFTAFEAERLADARLACQSALALRGQSSAAHSLLGLIYEKEGRRAEAIREFQVVLQLNPDSAADRAHLERLQHLPSRRAPALGAWLQQDRRRPLLAGILTAGVVMIGGLWMAAGALRPEAARSARVVPSNVQPLRGAPGAVAPAAGSLRLPPPIVRTPAATNWPSAANPGLGTGPNPAGPVGIPPAEQMNARMQALAPRLFGRQTYAPTRPAPPRTPALAPAPVRLPGYAVVPHDSGSRPSSLPTLPDARDGGTAAPDSTAAAPAAMPPIAPEGAAATPPGAPALAADRDEPAEGSSYIRIRPLTGEGAGGAANSTPAGAAPMRTTAGIRPAPAPSVSQSAGPSLAEARLHQQNGLKLWRDRDFAAAYQEYEYAAQLYRLIAARGGPEAAAAQEGLRAAEQGMRASSGAR
jgi:hypothetical protein